MREQRPDVPIFMALRRLTGEWREDPDKLAVLAAAWSLAGFWSGAIVFEVAESHERPDGDGWYESIGDEKAIERLECALYRRNRLKLRHQAEGLILALEALAADVDFARLHRTRENACVIECRELSIEERVAKLRERRPVCVPVEDEVDV